jgi:hypothetical protein
MELSDVATLRACLEVNRPGRRRRTTPRMPVLRPNTPVTYCAPVAKANGRRNCRCGLCGDCVENARWERVFQTKFADPEYYGGLRVRNTSPLNSW